MKVELTIKDDRELKAHIRDCIRGEVTKIAREEIKSVVVGEVVRKVSSDNEDWWRRVVRDEIRTMIKRKFGTIWDSTDRFLAIAREELKEILKEDTLKHLKRSFNTPRVREKFIEKVAKESVRDLILKALDFSGEKIVVFGGKR